MCLEVRDKEFKGSVDGYGYKVYKRRESDGYFFIKGSPVPNREWVEAETIEIQDDDWNSYRSGFHIFTNLKKAISKANERENAYVVLVRYQGAHTSGKQWTGRCVVAQRMKILKCLYQRKDGKVVKNERKVK